MLKRNLLLSLALVFAASGCDKGDKDKAGGDTTANAANAAKPTPPKSDDGAKDKPMPEKKAPVAEGGPGAKPTVRVIETGKEPRRELRYSMDASGGETVALEMRMAMTIKMQAAAMPRVVIPPFVMTMKIDRQEKVGDSELKYGLEVTNVEVKSGAGADPNVAKMMGAEMKKVIGMKGTAIVDSRGFNRDVKLDLPASLPPQMRQVMEGTKQSLDQMSSPLPAEPVGVGAKWEVTQNIRQQGITLKQSIVYELKELTDKTALLGTVTSQKGDRQKATMPGMPPGVNAELLDMKGSAKGDVTLEFARLMPKKATMAGDSNSSFTVSAQGQTQNMSVKAEMGMTLTGK